MDTHLRKLLDELDAAIDRVRQDDSNLTELRSLNAAVQLRLDGDPEAEEHHGLAEHLEEAATRFEADHPTLTEALRRAADVLGAAGI